MQVSPVILMDFIENLIKTIMHQVKIKNRNKTSSQLQNHHLVEKELEESYRGPRVIRLFNKIMVSKIVWTKLQNT